MFTKYRGIEIPQNYSGSRFSAPPPDIEMKTHRPSTVYTPSKTSISPTFQASLESSEPSSVEEIPDNVYEIEEASYDNSSVASENSSAKAQELVSSDIPKQESNGTNNKSGVFEEFRPFVSKFLKNISSDDLLLLSLVILLFGDGGEESSELILPLLCLFLYR